MVGRLALFVACLVAIAVAVDYEAEFTAWAAKFNKVYTATERKQRFGIWKENYDWVQEWNAAGHSSTATLNRFGDLQRHERQARLQAISPEMRQIKEHHIAAAAPAGTADTVSRATLPSAFDWRNYSAVTPIKDQANCGGCWAFASAGAAESQLLINNYNSTAVPDLSEEEALDCCGSYSMLGCNGGDEVVAWQCMQGLGGYCSESVYAFNSGTSGVSGSCKVSGKAFSAWVKSYRTSTPTYDETAMATMIQTYGPVTASINASSDSFTYYSSGIFFASDCNGDPNAANHVVMVVGWGTNGTLPYWIVRNSWGTQWGMSGYMYWAKDQNNFCGIANYIHVPVMCNPNNSECNLTAYGSAGSTLSVNRLFTALSVLFILAISKLF